MTKDPTKNESQEVTAPVKQLVKEKQPEQTSPTNSEQKAEETVQVLGKTGNTIDRSIVLNAMRCFAKRQELDSSNPNKKTLNELLEEDFFGDEKNAAELNVITNKEIETALNDGTLEKIKKVTEPDKSTYTYNGAILIQHVDAEGNFTFRPIEKFTGVLMVHRSIKGKFYPKQIDVVEYKNGIPVAVSKATKGKSRIANIDLLEKQAATRIEALTSNQK
jgi:hypothetical protein